MFPIVIFIGKDFEHFFFSIATFFSLLLLLTMPNKAVAKPKPYLILFCTQSLSSNQIIVYYKIHFSLDFIVQFME